MASESFTVEGPRSLFDWIKERAIDALGGPARFQVILVMAAVLGLDSADKGTVSAVSDQLKQAFDIGNIEIGLLLAVVSFVGAIATLPMGVLADRVRRRVVLMIAVATWAAAMIACGIATSYWFLLVCRLALGAVTAAAWPCVASMTGDFFPARERPSIFGLILSGELIGAGVGFVIAGEVSTLANWRWAFHVMALPSIVLVWVIWRYLPEPDRGTQHWLEVGEQDPEAASGPDLEATSKAERAGGADGELTPVEEKALTSNYAPRPEMIVREDPTRWGLWRTLGYLLRIPSYWLLIIASMLAYFFFSGMRGFAMIYFTQHFGLSRWLVTMLVIVVGAGAIVGLVVGGRLSERLLDRGRIEARVTVAAIALFLSIPLLALGIWSTSVWIGLAALTAGAGSLAAALAPIDAARLDIVHPRMWGRGEAGRMTIRSVFEGAAPLLFGAVSRWLGGDSGLMWTFLIMLIPTASAGFFVLPARRAYPRDVATAAASIRAMASAQQHRDDRRS